MNEFEVENDGDYCKSHLTAVVILLQKNYFETGTCRYSISSCFLLMKVVFKLKSPLILFPTDHQEQLSVLSFSKVS